MPENFYELFEIPVDADDDEIKQSYREMVKEYHPDQNESPNAQEQLTTIQTARDVLLDKDERERYDSLGHKSYSEQYLGELDGFRFTGGRSPISKEEKSRRETEDSESRANVNEFFETVNDILDEEDIGQDDMNASRQTFDDGNEEPPEHEPNEDERVSDGPMTEEANRFEKSPNEVTDGEVAAYALQYLAVQPISNRTEPVKSMMSNIRNSITSVGGLIFVLADSLLDYGNTLSLTQFYVMTIGLALVSVASFELLNGLEPYLAVALYVVGIVSLSKHL